MDNVCDLEVESGERTHRPEAADRECAEMLPLVGGDEQDCTSVLTCNLLCEQPCIQTSVNRLSVRAAQNPASAAMERECLCASVEPPTAPDRGPNPCVDNVNTAAERLARESLLNEHFNNPLPQESQGRVSRTGVTDGRDGGTPRPTNQDPANSGRPRDDTASALDDCPICTESYGREGEASVVLLNCDHGVCQSCLAVLLSRSSDRSRVRCPLCRQNTPLLRWEVFGLREASGFCPQPRDGAVAQGRPPSPGLCRRVEEHLQVRAETARVWGCFPHPRWIMRAVRRAQHHCTCCYVTLLLTLYLVELSFLALVFLPIVVLVLLFTLAG
ncbi:uncharacterized protein LOC143490268 [Brachyhypopomus gauderio]|uniref:uncharacterized protein LOC143490268 n=1 Tax=Brachyhypopomus gauderio TaxID=698409 RepID=UPI004041679C